MKYISSFKKRVLAHKVWSSVILVILIAVGYGAYSALAGEETATRYVMGRAEVGELVSTITGTGQVAASEQTSITANVSGDEITSIPVKAGDEVVKGQPIAYIESDDAVKAVSNAQLALDNARLSYERAEKDNAVQQDGSETSDLKKAYESGYNAIANAFIDLPAIFMGVNDIYYNSAHSPYFTDTNVNIRGGPTAVSYKSQAGVTFDAAKREYDKAFMAYKTLTVSSSPEEISALLKSTQSILKQLLSALSGTYSTIEYINDRYTTAAPSEMTSDKSTLSGYINRVNSNSSSIENALTGIDDAKDSSTTSDLNMRTADLNQSKAADSLRDANTALADHVVRAPFSGLIAKVSAKVGDKASTGGAIATIISKNKIVTITLNEIDAAKVKNGDKAQLRFDAIDDLVLDAHVSNIDLVGTVSQGVVSYSVEIAFDENDARVKPGMTVNAEIISASKAGVLLVPSSAVKTTGGRSFVQVLVDGEPVNKPVAIGDSNDTSVEIVSGLSAGDQIVARTVTVTAAAQSGSSIFDALRGRNTRQGTTGAGGTAGTVRTMGGTRTGNATFMAVPAGSAPAGATVQIISQ